MITDPMAVLAVLLGVLAALFTIGQQPFGKRVFRAVPLLVFAYFVPTTLSNLGLIPLESPLYEFIKQWLLPASLVLLTLSVDIPGILRLGPKVLILFLAATATIVLGGPLAYLLCSPLIPAELTEEAWKGLAALSGSWIGGGANFVAIGESVGASDSTIAMMVVVDVAVANVWMAVLLWFSGRDEKMDAAIGADRRSMEELKRKIEKYQQATATMPALADYLLMLFLCFTGVAVAQHCAAHLPDVGSIVRRFTWVVLLVTALGVGLSFTRLRKLEGAGASRVGSVMLYLLVASIGAGAEFRKVLDVPVLLLVGAVWMTFHAVILLLLRRFLKAPIFYMAVGSQANVGGAASAPIVANAFHPALTPVGVLLAVAGYVIGTVAGLVCAALLQLAARIS
jgi:uncharacterized membrane protein